MKASGFALAGAVLTFFGFMHGEKIGIGETPVVAVSYLVVSILFFGCSKFAGVADKSVTELDAAEGDAHSESVLA
jgi:AGZA family xanthine/uracil permease-like MFS transporter